MSRRPNSKAKPRGIPPAAEKRATKGSGESSGEPVKSPEAGAASPMRADVVTGAPAETASPAAREKTERSRETPEPRSRKSGGWSPLKQSAIIIGGFALVAGLILALSWSGYRLRTDTQAAEAALAAHDCAAAVPRLQRIVARYPTAWERQAQLGGCLLELERPQEALQAFEVSLKTNPKQNLDAQMGQAYFLLGDREMAIERLQRAIKVDPYDAKANYYIGLYYMNRKDFARAAFFLQGAAADPKLFEKAKPHLETIRGQLLGG